MKSELRLQLLHSRMQLLHSLESSRCGPSLIPRQFLRVFQASGGVVVVVVVDVEDAATCHAYILDLIIVVIIIGENAKLVSYFETVFSNLFPLGLAR